MAKVLVKYVKTGQIVPMEKVYADILVRVNHVEVYNAPAETLQKETREITAAPAAQKNKPGRKPSNKKQTYKTRDLTAQDI